MHSLETVQHIFPHFAVAIMLLIKVGNFTSHSHLSLLLGSFILLEHVSQSLDAVHAFLFTVLKTGQDIVLHNADLCPNELQIILLTLEFFIAFVKLSLHKKLITVRYV